MLRLLLRGASPSTTLPSQAITQNPAQGSLKGSWRRLVSSDATVRAAGEALLARSAPRRLGAGSTHPLRASLQRPSWTSTVAPRFARSCPRRGFRFSAWRGSRAEGADKEKPLSLAGRLKKLSREYGWSAVGVYFALSVLDFPFCFLVVRSVGTDRIGQLEHYVVSNIKSVIPEPVRQKASEYWLALKGIETKELGDDDITDKMEMAGWGVREAHEKNQEQASLATQLALAYAIHKSFIFFRVPLAAAVTPKVVKTLRSWGWNIGKKAPR